MRGWKKSASQKRMERRKKEAGDIEESKEK